MGLLNDIRIIQTAGYNKGIRTEKIQLRLTAEEKEVLHQMAKTQSLDVSNFLRWLIFSKYMNDFLKD